MRISMIPGRSLKGWAAIAAGATAAAVFGMATPAFAAAVTITLSAYSGPSGGGNTITATAPTSTTPVFVAGSTYVEFQQNVGTTTTCSATYAAAAAVSTTAGVVQVPTSSVIILSGNKLAITVPAAVALAGSQTSAKYNVCVYSGNTVAATGVTGSPLIANQLPTTPYQIAQKPTIASISPSSGPAQGGQTVTVTGTNFPALSTTSTTISATLGGSPMTITSVAANGTSFTATTPAHPAGGPLLLTVTTIGGTVNTLLATTTKANLYTYTNGISITPNTAPNTKTAQVVDVLGVGFSSMYFTTTTGTTPDDANSHVYLVPGTYNATNNGGNKTNGEINECTGVLVVSDNELLCTLNLTTSMTNGSTAIGSRTVNDASFDVNGSNPTWVTSPTANFTASDVGLVLSGTGIPSNDTIASVTNATTAVLTTAVTGTATGAGPITIGGRSDTAALTSGSTSATITGLVAGDVGHTVSGPGIAPGTTITAVASTTATLSTAATATNAAAAVTIGTPAPTPVGTYTLTAVSDGAVNANVSDPNYLVSVISSGSTFTVAEY